MNSKALLYIFIVAAVIVGGIYIFQKKILAPTHPANVGNVLPNAEPSVAEPSAPLGVTVAPASSTEVRAVIENFAFFPRTIQVKKGTKVVWTNKDSVQHTVTADGGLFASKLLKQGESYTYVFDKAGTFAYHCVPHPNMKGTIIVTE